MKHLLTLAVGAIAALALAATPSLAGTFGLFYCRGHCDKCSCCIRPDNAFTPVVCGSADGLTAQGYAPYFRTGTCGLDGCGLIGPGHHHPVGYIDDGHGSGAFGDNCGRVPFIGLPVAGGGKCCR
jgi:hypothetical protein